MGGPSVTNKWPSCYTIAHHLVLLEISQIWSPVSLVIPIINCNNDSINICGTGVWTKGLPHDKQTLYHQNASETHILHFNYLFLKTIHLLIIWELYTMYIDNILFLSLLLPELPPLSFSSNFKYYFKKIKTTTICVAQRLLSLGPVLGTGQPTLKNIWLPISPQVGVGIHVYLFLSLLIFCQVLPCVGLVHNYLILLSQHFHYYASYF